MATLFCTTDIHLGALGRINKTLIFLLMKGLSKTSKSLTSYLHRKLCLRTLSIKKESSMYIMKALL